eukprot:gene9778-10813_t
MRLSPVLVVLAIFFISTVAISDISVVIDCLKRRLEGKRYRGAVESPFFLNYGESGVEAFNILSNKQIKEIEFLAECVQAAYPPFFLLSAKGSEHHYLYGGSNITHLTGIVQEALPDLRVHLLRSFSAALRHADWAEHSPAFGIRSIFLATSTALPLSEQPRQVVQKEAFVVYPHGNKEQLEREQREALQQKREAEFSRLRPFLNYHEASVYTLLLPLSSRNQFIGGDVLVQLGKLSSQQTSVEEHDVYDDEERADATTESISTLGLVHGGRLKGAVGEEVELLTPERGSMLVLPPGRPFGLDEVQYGQRSILVVELWRYKDAPVGNNRADEALGQVLGYAGGEQDL